MRTNEAIIHEWNQTEVSQRIADTEMFAINHGFPEWHKPTVVDFWLAQRLQDLQAIKEMIDGMKGYSSPDCSDPFLVEQGYEVALQNVQLKLDELMK